MRQTPHSIYPSQEEWLAVAQIKERLGVGSTNTVVRYAIVAFVTMFRKNPSRAMSLALGLNQNEKR